MSLATYESMKKHWIATHPNATHTQYQIAMQKIAKVCKV